MTRLVILAIPRLKVCCINHALELQTTSVIDALQFNPYMDRILLPKPSPRQQAGGDAEYAPSPTPKAELRRAAYSSRGTRRVHRRATRFRSDRSRSASSLG